MQDDSLLVSQTLAGDKQAFGQLVQKHWESVYARMLSTVRSHDDAEELTNDAFIKAYLNLRRLRKHSSFHIWLHQIAKYHCRDWLRRRPESCVSLDEMPDEADHLNDSAEDRMLLQEKLHRTMEAIEHLPEMDKALMRDFYLEDVSYETLQGRYNLSKSAVTMRLFKARQKVKERVKKLLPGFGAFPWHKALLMGGVEAVKMGIKTKLAIIGVSALLVSGGGVLVWHYNQPVQEKPVPEAVRSASEASLDLADKPLPGKKTVGEKEEISQEKVEKFIAFLDGLDKAQDSSQDGGSGNTLTAGDETPLSYEEELRQRLIRIKKTPEWKALQAEHRELNIEGESVKTPESFTMAFMAFDLNPYSALGIATREEGEEMAMRGEISKKDWQYIKEVGRQFQAKSEEYYAKKVAIMRAVDELHGRKLELLGMTHREFCIAIGVPYGPRLSYYLPPLPSD